MTEIPTVKPLDNALAQPELRGLVLDLGELGRKKIRRLKQDEDSLAQEIQEAIDDFLQHLPPVPNVEIVPIVLFYEKLDDAKSVAAE